MEAYNGDVKKLLDKGHITELTEQEDEQCKAEGTPTSCIAHHAVYKESKSSL